MHHQARQRHHRRQVIELPWTTISDVFPPVIPGRPTPSDDKLPSSTPVLPLVSLSSSTTPIASSSTPLAPVSSSSETPNTPATSSTTPIVPVVASSNTRAPTVTTITSYVRAPSANASALGAEGSLSSNSPTSATGDENNTGAIIGGIIGGIAGIAVVAFIAVFLIRRKRRRELEDAGNITFNPSEFRKSAVLMRDDGYNAPNPSMGERRLPTLPSPEQDPYRPHPFAVPSYNDHGGYGLHTPGTWTPTHDDMPNQFSANPYSAEQYSANPFMTPAPYTHSPFYDAPSPDSGYGESPVSGYRSESPPASAGVMSGATMAAAGATAAAAAATGMGVVLAQIGGAPVLTRTNSAATIRTARHKPMDLSISVPGMLPGEAANLQVVQGGRESPRSHTLSPQLTRQPSGASKYSEKTITQDQVTGLVRSMSRGMMQRNGSAKVLERSGSLKGLERNISVKSVNASRVRIHGGSPNPTDEAHDDTVDLTRASVSPYQAAQYAEISKRLNADVPTGMPSPLVEEYVNGRKDITAEVLMKKDLPPLPPPSPFVHGGPSETAKRTSADSIQSITMANTTSNTTASQVSEYDFPIPPPSPVVVSTRHQSFRADIHDDIDYRVQQPWLPGGKPRVDSTPPQLPDFSLDGRLSVGSYMTSAFGPATATPSKPSFSFNHANGSNHSISSGGHHDAYQYHRSYLGQPSGQQQPQLGPLTTQATSGFSSSAFSSPTSPDTMFASSVGSPVSPATPGSPSANSINVILDNSLHSNNTGRLNGRDGDSRSLNGNMPMSATAPFYPSGITAGGSPFLVSRFPVSVGNSLRSPLAVSFEGSSEDGHTGGGMYMGGSSLGHGLASGSSQGHGGSGLRVEVKLDSVQDVDERSPGGRSFTAQSAHREIQSEADKGVKAVVVEDGKKEGKERPLTVYDPEDAYGGI